MSDKKEVFDRDEQWQAREELANFILHQAQVTQEHQVPAWERGKAFSRDEEPWWKWQGLPVMSMACSIVAICLVLMKVELVIKPEGILLTFAGGKENTIEEIAKSKSLINEKIDERVNEKLNLKLKEFASEQQVVLAHYMADFTVNLASNQQDNNLQLASYILGTSRQERKEDMTDFINYINVQRKNENLDQTIRFDQLERAINYQTIQHRINLNKDNNTYTGESGLTLKPANWIPQEQ
jgi:hypothetical protein